MRDMPNIEMEMNQFNDRAADASDMHLLDLRANHKYGCGEFRITPSYHTKRYADMRNVGRGGSSAASCAEASHEH